jgi:hypothetical protein
LAVDKQPRTCKIYARMREVVTSTATIPLCVTNEPSLSVNRGMRVPYSWYEFREKIIISFLTMLLVESASLKIRLWNKVEMIKMDGWSRFNPLTPELNPSNQRCLPRIFLGDFNF